MTGGCHELFYELPASALSSKFLEMLGKSTIESSKISSADVLVVLG